MIILYYAYIYLLYAARKVSIVEDEVYPGDHQLSLQLLTRQA